MHKQNALLTFLTSAYPCLPMTPSRPSSQVADPRFGSLLQRWKSSLTCLVDPAGYSNGSPTSAIRLATRPGNPTWLSGKPTVNGSFNGQNIYKYYRIISDYINEEISIATFNCWKVICDYSKSLLYLGPTLLAEENLPSVLKPEPEHCFFKICGCSCV